MVLKENFNNSHTLHVRSCHSNYRPGVKRRRLDYQQNENMLFTPVSNRLISFRTFSKSSIKKIKLKNMLKFLFEEKIIRIDLFVQERFHKI